MSISGGVHLVSSNHLQGLPVKQTATPFFCRNLVLKSKCPLYYQSLARAPLRLTCNASSSNNDRRNPSHRQKNYQGPPPPRGKFKNYQDQDDLLETGQMLSSQNGRSTTSDTPMRTKSGNPADIVELFKKHLPQLRETTQNRPGNSNRSYGLNATMLNRDKEDRETFKSLLKLLKTSGVNQKDSANNIGTKGTVDNLGKSLKYEEAGVDDSDSDIADEDSDFDDNIPDMLDSEPEPLTSSRPSSSFSRRSAIPMAKNEPVMASETHREETQMLGKEERTDSKSLFYESESGSDVGEEDPGTESFVYESEHESVAEQSEGPQEEKIEDLSALKLSELREIAKSRGLKGYSKLKKAELLEQLSLS